MSDEQEYVPKEFNDANIRVAREFKVLAEAAEARCDTLVKALTDARAAIASLPMEALGYASDPTGAQIHWPVRDELLHRIDEALPSNPPAGLAAR